MQEARLCQAKGFAPWRADLALGVSPPWPYPDAILNLNRSPNPSLSGNAIQRPGLPIRLRTGRNRKRANRIVPRKLKLQGKPGQMLEIGRHQLTSCSGATNRAPSFAEIVGRLRMRSIKARRCPYVC